LVVHNVCFPFLVTCDTRVSFCAVGFRAVGAMFNALITRMVEVLDCGTEDVYMVMCDG
jgi:hypothetical protein